MRAAKNRGRAVATVVALEPRRASRARAESMELGDGSIATVQGGALELHDANGRLLVRYFDGSAEIAAPSGDLVLSSPTGRVVLRSALDVEVEAARDVVHRAGRTVEIAAGRAEPQVRIDPRTTSLATEQLRVTTGDVEVAAGTVSTVARAIATKAGKVAVTAEKYELVATKIVERAKDTFRDVADLAQTRVGRARTIVSSLFTLNARRTVLASEEDTSIDGRKILLG